MATNTNTASTSAPVGHQQQHHAAQVGQYQHHQQLQSSAHHNVAAAAYYQQAHLYSNYQQAHGHSQDQQQQQQQHTAQTDHHAHPHPHHHQHHAGSLTGASNAPGTASGSSSGAATNSVFSTAVAANAQHQHGSVHQPTTDSRSTSLNHTGWSPGVGSLGPQAHHAVVTDHSTLAYVHAYQSHNSTVGDHHRGSNGQLTTQPIGTAAQQASTYSVDSLYNAPAAAAAAAAAYGYNSYNAAFFQTSTSGPHTQTGHPSAASISTFWGHNQNTQPQRTSHTQNQTAVQQRQAIVSETAASNYMHDPRLYYGRPYGQGMQNYNQHHAQSQNETMQHRLAAVANQHQHQQQQHQLVQQHDQHHHPQQQLLHHVAHQYQTQTQNRSPIESPQQQSNVTNQSQSFMAQAQIPENQSIAYQQNQSRKNPSVKTQLPQHQLPKQDVAEPNNQQSAKNHLEQVVAQQANTSHQVSSDKQKSSSQQQAGKEKDAYSQDSHKNLTKNTASNMVTKDPVPQSANSNQPSSGRSQTVHRISDSDSSSSYQRKPQNNTNGSQTRNIFCAAQEERMKMSAQQESYKRSIDAAEKDTRSTQDSFKSQPSKHQDNEQSALEDGMGSLTLSARKTTWASIASQPAKVSQPKSLRSKIAGSNSVLSSAKHLASVSLDNSNMESKNGINPAIKSSVSAAATSIQRSSVPPPVSSITPTVANLNLKLLGDEPSEKSKISWPAVNASLSLSLAREGSAQKEADKAAATGAPSEKDNKRDDVYTNNPTDYRDRESSFKDHNHNQGPNMVNSYQPPINRNRRDDNWNNRRDNRVRRDSDRREPFEQHHDRNKNNHLDDQREMAQQRRDYNKPSGRNYNYRNDDYRDREYKPRSAMINHQDDHRNKDLYQTPRFPPNKHDSGESHQNPPHQHLNHQPPAPNVKHNDNPVVPNHHYNNVRDGHSNATAKPNLNLHPHLNPSNFNPKSFDLEPVNARYFIIKSYSEDDIHRSIKYSIWCSTNHGNRRLDEAYRQQEGKGPIFLFFSVNGSGHFCGMAQMTSSVDFDSSSGVWAQNKWQGEFSVKWIYVKDVPNAALRHITLENNEDKPVTNSRDTQEVPSEKGKSVLKIIHQFIHKTSLFDDFSHYERRQEEEKLKKSHMEQPPHRLDDRERVIGGGGGHRGFGRPNMNSRSYNGYPPNRDRSARYVSRD